MTPTEIPISNQPISIFDNPQLEQRLFIRIIKVLLVIIGVIIVLWVIALYVLTELSATPQKVSDRFVHALDSRNTTLAYRLAAPSLYNYTSLAQFTAIDKTIVTQVTGQPRLYYRNFAVGHLLGKRISYFVFIYQVPSKTSKTKYLYVRTEMGRHNGTWLVNSVLTTDVVAHNGFKL
jgi:hypothetical protein